MLKTNMLKTRQISRHLSDLASIATPPPLLPWSEFFTLKKSRRAWDRSGAILLGTLSFVSGSLYFGAVADFDPIEPVFGLDPNIAYGLASFGVGAAGVISGLLLSGQIWRLTRTPQLIRQLDAREAEFFHRIAQHRPKEIRTNLQHPLPDYYGEKIGSVGEYRQWLRATKEWCVKMGINQK